MKRLSNCVWCGRKAEIWQGIVNGFDEPIRAGWCCENHIKKMQEFKDLKWKYRCDNNYGEFNVGYMKIEEEITLPPELFEI